MGAVKLGTSGGNINDTGTGVCCSGTLGSLVTLSGTQYILSNNHVLAKSDGGVAGSGGTGDAISQPGLIDTNCSVSGTQTVAQPVAVLQSGIRTDTQGRCGTRADCERVGGFRRQHFTARRNTNEWRARSWGTGTRGGHHSYTSHGCAAQWTGGQERTHDRFDLLDGCGNECGLERGLFPALR